MFNLAKCHMLDIGKMALVSLFLYLVMPSIFTLLFIPMAYLLTKVLHTKRYPNTQFKVVSPMDGLVKSVQSDALNHIKVDAPMFGFGLFSIYSPVDGTVVIDCTDQDFTFFDKFNLSEQINKFIKSVIKSRRYVFTFTDTNDQKTTLRMTCYGLFNQSKIELKQGQQVNKSDIVASISLDARCHNISIEVPAEYKFDEIVKNTTLIGGETVIA